MTDTFIIMQIGNSDLDHVYTVAIDPAVRACGLEPKRVDKHNEGGLLKSEIDSFIQGSQILIGDLTNERPNCYLEIGYAMGLGRLIRVILTCREDHSKGSANFRPGGPKVHFDLEGYDILYWDPNHLQEFRTQLENKIRKRQRMLPRSGSMSQTVWDHEWLGQHRAKAVAGLQKFGLNGYLEIRSTLLDFEINKTARELVEAAQRAQISTFGLPMGMVFPSDPNAPHAVADGIVAEMINEHFHAYDYWVAPHQTVEWL